MEGSKTRSGAAKHLDADTRKAFLSQRKNGLASEIQMLEVALPEQQAQNDATLRQLERSLKAQRDELDARLQDTEDRLARLRKQLDETVAELGSLS